MIPCSAVPGDDSVRVYANGSAIACKSAGSVQAVGSQLDLEGSSNDVDAILAQLSYQPGLHKTTFDQPAKAVRFTVQDFGNLGRDALRYVSHDTSASLLSTDAA